MSSRHAELSEEIGFVIAWVAFAVLGLFALIYHAVGHLRAPRPPPQWPG